MTRGEKLIKLRGDKTQKEVLAELKEKGKYIDKNTLCNAEKNRNISNTTLEILANYYNVSLDYLKLEEINNSTNTNIDINKELGLSDKSIEIIKQIRDDENDEGCWLDKGIFNYFIEEFKGFEIFLASLSIVKNCQKYMIIFKQFELLKDLEEYLYIEKEREKIVTRCVELIDELGEGLILYGRRIEVFKEFIDLINKLGKELKKSKSINKERVNELLEKIRSKAFENSNYLYTISCTNTLQMNSCLDRFMNKIKGEEVIRKRDMDEKIDDIFSQYLKSKNK